MTHISHLLRCKNSINNKIEEKWVTGSLSLSLRGALKANAHKRLFFSMITTFVFTFSVQYLAAREALRGRTAGAELKVNIKCLSQAEFFFVLFFFFVCVCRSIKRGKEQDGRRRRKRCQGYSTNSTGDFVRCSNALVSTKDDMW